MHYDMKLKRKEIDLKLKERVHEIIEGPRLPSDSGCVTLIRYIRELENALIQDEAEFEQIEKDNVSEINGAVMLALVSSSVCTGDKICCLCSSNETKKDCRYCYKHSLFEFYQLESKKEEA